MDAILQNQRVAFSRAGQIILWTLLFVLLVVGLAVGIHAVMAGNTVGMDVHTFYLAAQNVFLLHQSPYGEDVAVESQLAVFGRLANANDDQLGFSYPPYSLLLLAPIAHLPFEWVQAIWMAFFLLGSTCAMLILFPKKPLLAVMGILLYYPFTFGIILGNFVNIIAWIILAGIAVLVIAPKRSIGVQILLGALAAWTTIKPQFVWLYLAFLLLVALKNRYWPFLLSFGASLAGFLGISFLLVPNWPALWLERVGKYVGYVGYYPNLTLYLNQLRSPEDAPTLTIALAVLLLGVTAWALYEWWHGRLTPLTLLAWIGIVTYLINPRTVSYTQIAFFIPLLIWAQVQINPHSLPVAIFFWGSLVLSWVIFAVGRFGLSGTLTEEWRLVVGCAWMFWLLAWPAAGAIPAAGGARTNSV
ncbi:MAG: DUF2029 domain-containing protein [Chloroflexi bacterium]|nr:DUF2029 domain-containing protein [Chloroflexota bacterium]